MAASVVTRATSSQASITTSHTFTLPTGVASGDLLIAALSAAVTSGTTPPVITGPSGWTLGDSDGSGRVGTAWYWKVATGSDANTFSTDLSAQSAHSVLRITAFDDTGTPVGSTASAGTTPACDPPSHSPAGGSDDYLWIAMTLSGRGSDSSLAISAAPTNYTDLNTIATERATAATAERTLTAASEDPGAFSQTDVQANFNWTLAVLPAAAGGSTVELAGTANLTLAASGNAVGDSALAGSGALVLTASADLVGDAALSGAGSLSLAASGALDGVAALSGAAALSLSVSGDLIGSAALSGSGALSLVASGDLAGDAALSGAGVLSLVASGNLDIQSFAELSGSGALSLTASGDLIGYSDLSGLAALGLTASGDLEVVGNVELSGSASLSLTASGDLLIDIDGISFVVQSDTFTFYALSEDLSVRVLPRAGLTVIQDARTVTVLH